MTDGIIRVKLVSMVPARRANLFLNYNLSLGGFVPCKDREHFCNAYLLESVALDFDMEDYVRNLEDKEKPL